MAPEGDSSQTRPKPNPNEGSQDFLGAQETQPSWRPADTRLRRFDLGILVALPIDLALSSRILAPEAPIWIPYTVFNWSQCSPGLIVRGPARGGVLVTSGALPDGL